MKKNLMVAAVAGAVAVAFDAGLAAAGELTLFDAAKGAGDAKFENGVFRLEGDWDLSGYGTVELVIEPKAPGKSTCNVRFLNPDAAVTGRGAAGAFIAEVNAGGPKRQTLEFNLPPPDFPEWTKVSSRLGRAGLQMWGLNWHIWPTDRWTWHSGFYFDTVRYLRWALDPKKVTAIEVRVAEEVLGDIDTSVKAWRLLRLAVKGPATKVANPPAYAKMTPEEFFPFIDKYGQFKWLDWPGKMRADADFAAARERETKDLAAHPGPKDWDKWGGWAKGPQLKATGHFRVEKWKGKWWLVDPDGRLWWSHGAVRVIPSSAQTPIYGNREGWFEWLPDKTSPFERFYHTRDELMWPYFVVRGITNTFDFSAANLYRKYGEDWRAQWADVCHRRLRSWGANTIANSSDLQLCLMGRTPYTDRFELKSRPLSGALGKVGWWPFRDPWDPSFRKDVRRNLEEHRREMGDPWCFGFFIDNELQWGWTMRCGTDVTESFVDQPAKLEMLKDLKAKYGTAKKLNAAWHTAFTDWNAFLANTNQLSDLKAAQKDIEAFSVRIAEAYFSQIRDEFKKFAPNKLYLGCRFSGTDSYAVRTMAKYADVMSFNIYTPDLANLVVGAIGPSCDKPLIVGEWAVGALDRGCLTPHNVFRHTQKERAAQYLKFVESALRDKNVVGVHWHQFADPAASGRYDGLTKNAGWTDLCDTPYPEMVEAIRDIGYRMYEVRAGNLTED